MTLQRRVVAGVTALSFLTLGGAFVSISVAADRAREVQLDEALQREALDEVQELTTNASRLAVRNRVLPSTPGPHAQYAAVYGPGGELRAATATWRGPPPARERLPTARGVPFNLRVNGEALRAVLVSVPSLDGVTLLVGAPRTDLDGDPALLRRAMALVFVVACAWTAAVASWFARRLTRDHQRIAEVAHRAAGGDLSARVARTSTDAEAAQLGRDLDETIARLATVVDGQRRFIANAAHELRSPLTTLLGEVSFTLRRERSAEEYRAALTEALASAEQLRALTDDLLALARLGAIPPGPAEAVALALVADGAAQDVAAAAEARGVRFERVGDGASAWGHASDLRRLARNLLENAVRHAPPGSAVRVRVAREGDDAVLAVEDAGDGVPAAERERIFEPFYRASVARASGDAGAGLGLAIAREVAHQHRGELTCEAGEGGRGARFVLRLPAHEAAAG